MNIARTTKCRVDELCTRVHDAYERLKAEATVDAHLVAMTEKQVTEDPRGDGKTIHVRGDDTA